MSHRLATCAACGKLNLHLEVTEQQSADMADLVFRGSSTRYQWRTRVLICQQCAKPVITFWPMEPDVDEVLGALGISRDSLHASQKGGAR
jgi:hypothetical protein